MGKTGNALAGDEWEAMDIEDALWKTFAQTIFFLAVPFLRLSLAACAPVLVALLFLFVLFSFRMVSVILFQDLKEISLRF